MAIRCPKCGNTRRLPTGRYEGPHPVEVCATPGCHHRVKVIRLKRPRPRSKAR